jgi:hypothetical protein
MYLARVPAGGIPARSGATPGTETVDIYRVDETSGDIVSASRTEFLNNIYPLAYSFDSADPYIQIFQDRFGEWFCEDPPTEESATQYARVIGFTIAGSETGLMKYSNDQMRATVDDNINGTTPPLDGNLTLLVHDDQGVCPLAVAGAKGWAIRNDNLGSGSPYYQILTCDQLASVGRALIQQSMCGPDHKVVTVTDFQVMSVYPHSMSPVGRILATRVYNPHKHRAPFGSQIPPYWVTVEWGTLPHDVFGLPFTNEGYYIIDVDKTEMKIPVAGRITAEKHIQWQLGTFGVETCQRQQDMQWEDAFPVKDC